MQELACGIEDAVDLREVVHPGRLVAHHVPRRTVPVRRACCWDAARVLEHAACDQYAIPGCECFAVVIQTTAERRPLAAVPQRNIGGGLPTGKSEEPARRELVVPGLQRMPPAIQAAAERTP